MSKNIIITFCCILTVILFFTVNISSEKTISSVLHKPFHKLSGYEEDEFERLRGIDNNFMITEKALNTNRDRIEDLEIQIKRLRKPRQPVVFPVGTVIASMLPYKEFQKAADDSWKPADGRKVSAESEYAKFTGSRNLPDMRGMFMRGLNQFDPLTGSRQDDYRDREGEGRKAGSFQIDATCLPNRSFTADALSSGAHTHIYASALSQGGKSGSSARASSEIKATASAGPHKHSVSINGGGDEETRPVNITVYYYIKIN
jgi:hypothetical protein